MVNIIKHSQYNSTKRKLVVIEPTLHCSGYQIKKQLKCTDKDSHRSKGWDRKQIQIKWTTL